MILSSTAAVSIQDGHAVRCLTCLTGRDQARSVILCNAGAHKESNHDKLHFFSCSSNAANHIHSQSKQTCLIQLYRCGIGLPHVVDGLTRVSIGDRLTQEYTACHQYPNPHTHTHNNPRNISHHKHAGVRTDACGRRDSNKARMVADGTKCLDGLEVAYTQANSKKGTNPNEPIVLYYNPGGQWCWHLSSELKTKTGRPLLSRCR